VDVGLLEFFVREDLNKRAPRAMAVLRPLKVVLENYPDDLTEEMNVVNNPEDESAGTRKVPFSRSSTSRMTTSARIRRRSSSAWRPAREVRLRNAYLITCREAIKDASGRVIELRCTYDPATRGGDAPDGRKVKSTLHWVSAAHAVRAEVRLYDRLFTDENPGAATRIS
jgi:glutaminyl-tRNA synthetase